MSGVVAATIASAARSAGVFCMEAMWTRFLPHAVRIRRLVADGAIVTHLLRGEQDEVAAPVLLLVAAAVVAAGRLSAWPL